MHCNSCRTQLSYGTTVCPYCGALTPLAQQGSDTPLYQMVALIALAGIWMVRNIREARAQSIMADVDRMYQAYDSGNYEQVIHIAKSISIPQYYPQELHSRYSLILGLAQHAIGYYKEARGNLLVCVAGLIELRAPSQAIAVAYLFVTETCMREWQYSPSWDTAIVKLGIQFISEAIRLSPSDPYLYLRRASLYGEMREFQHLIQDAEKALRLDPQSSQARLLIRKAQMDSGM